MSNAPAFDIPRFEARHRMRLALEHADISVSDMADYLGVNRNTTSNYLNGHTRPNRAVVRLWALRCGVPLEWIEYGIEPADSPDTDPVTIGYLAPVVALPLAA